MHGWWAVSYVVLWLLVGSLTLLVIALARQIGTLHLRLGPRGALEIDTEGPPLGEAAEPMELVDADGRPVSVGGPGAPQLVLFVSPGCPVCRELLSSVGPAARAAGLDPIVVADAVGDELPSVVADASGAPVLAAPGVVDRMNLPGTPFALVLDALGVVRSKGTPNTLEQLEGLVDTARHRAAEAGVSGGIA
jgi:methylamine dehydrogenase accessory protein MauD